MPLSQALSVTVREARTASGCTHGRTSRVRLTAGPGADSLPKRRLLR
jgi:hypothetical protein